MGLHVLKPLFTMQAIKNIPKLSLLVWCTLKPLMPIFSNPYFSLLPLCHNANLIDFNRIKLYQQDQKENENYENEEITFKNHQILKYNCQGNREAIL
jgi:hypothetical protein